MFDFNCDLAQGYGIYKNDEELEIARYASSVNISAGFHAGDPVAIRKALMFAKDNNIALGAHIGYPDIQGFGKRQISLDDEELEAIITYQISAISAYAKTFGLIIEQVRTHGALKDAINESELIARVSARTIKKINPWLNLIVQNERTFQIVQQEGLKAALEADFNYYGSIREIRESEVKFDTIHFKSLEDIKKASEDIKPAPINYNRVQGQI